MELTFAPATAADADTVFAESKALIDTYEDLSAINYPNVLAWVRKKIDTNISNYVCVYADGLQAAFYRFCPSDGCMELDDLYVLPAFRGKGIGTRIIQTCISETTRPIMLYVFTRNSGAIRLYERMGFRRSRDVGSTRCIMTREAL